MSQSVWAIHARTKYLIWLIAAAVAVGTSGWWVTRGTDAGIRAPNQSRSLPTAGGIGEALRKSLRVDADRRVVDADRPLLRSAATRRFHELREQSEQVEEGDLVERPVEMLGVSVMPGPQMVSAVALSKEFRARYPNVPIVWGGIHASLLPEQTLRHPLIDAVVPHEPPEKVRAVVAQSLGRNLGACRGAAVCNANVTVAMIPPQTMFEPRQQQLDLRFSRLFRLGSAVVLEPDSPGFERLAAIARTALRQ